MKNNLLLMVILMIIFSFLMSIVMLTFRNGIYNHLNKTYMALLMGSGMLIIDNLLNKNYTNLILSTVITLFFIYFIRNQTLIDDREFLKGMIEHHDMALLMSEKILEKTQDKRIIDLAENIIKTQQQEIDLMKSWL